MSIYSDVSFKLIDLLRLKTKDSQSSKLLEEVLEKNPLEGKGSLCINCYMLKIIYYFSDGHAACIFHLLHAVFIPTAKKINP